MTTEIRFAHYIKITTTANEYRYQNYYVNQNSHGHDFAPFQVQGNVANLNGDNAQIQLLFPTTEYALALVEEGDGNRRSRLVISTFNISAQGVRGDQAISTEFYIGLGASFSEDTIELRFNTAIDSVGSNFPARRLNQDNVGYLPLDSALSLR